MIVQLCYNLVMEAWLKRIAVRAIVYCKSGTKEISATVRKCAVVLIPPIHFITAHF